MPADTLDRRRFLAASGAAVSAAVRVGRAPAGPVPQLPDPARIQRLSWAGIRIETPGLSLFVDPWTNAAIWDGAWRGAPVPLEADTARRFALVTHLHNDHFDPAALRGLLGDTGSVVCLDTIAATVASRGLRVVSARLWEPVALDDVTVIAVPAVDGLGTPQVSWVIRAGGRKLLHGGDTLWHGHWWHIAREFGPLDAVFLPINGVHLSRLRPDSTIPHTLTPEQAVAAAVVTGARFAVPIHYGMTVPGNYEEYPDAEATFLRTARTRQVVTRVVAPGAWLEWPA